METCIVAGEKVCIPREDIAVELVRITSGLQERMTDLSRDLDTLQSIVDRLIAMD